MVVDNSDFEKNPIDQEGLDIFDGDVDETTVSEDSDLTGQALYQEDVTGGAMHVEDSDEPVDDMLLEGDSLTQSPEEYEEIDKGKIYEDDGE